MIWAEEILKAENMIIRERQGTYLVSTGFACHTDSVSAFDIAKLMAQKNVMRQVSIIVDDAQTLYQQSVRSETGEDVVRLQDNEYVRWLDFNDRKVQCSLLSSFLEEDGRFCLAVLAILDVAEYRADHPQSRYFSEAERRLRILDMLGRN